MRLRRLVIPGALAFVAVVLGACGGAAPRSYEQRLAAGRQLYEDYCIACHGADGSGGVIAPYLSPPPPDLRRIAARRGGVFPHAQVEDWIDGRDPIASHGTREMPVWGKSFRDETELNQLSETRVRGRITLLTDYLASIQVK
jgi:mono/diheme cytochrome c family protein